MASKLRLPRCSGGMRARHKIRSWGEYGSSRLAEQWIRLERSSGTRGSEQICVRCSRLLAYGCASIEDMAEQFPGLTFQGSGSADVDYLVNFLSITNYTDDLPGGSAG